MEEKTLAFLVDYPKKGDLFMFPDFYENMKDLIDERYEEVEQSRVSNIRWDARLQNMPYKAFIIKKKKQA
jgi:hypothetical protein